MQTRTTTTVCLKHLKPKTLRRCEHGWLTTSMLIQQPIFRHMYDSMYERIDTGSIPQLVLILADYQYKAAFVADHELNMVALHDGGYGRS